MPAAVSITDSFNGLDRFSSIDLKASFLFKLSLPPAKKIRV